MDERIKAIRKHSLLLLILIGLATQLFLDNRQELTTYKTLQNYFVKYNMIALSSRDIDGQHPVKRWFDEPDNPPDKNAIELPGIGYIEIERNDKTRTTVGENLLGEGRKFIVFRTSYFDYYNYSNEELLEDYFFVVTCCRKSEPLNFGILDYYGNAGIGEIEHFERTLKNSIVLLANKQWGINILDPSKAFADARIKHFHKKATAPLLGIPVPVTSTLVFLFVLSLGNVVLLVSSTQQAWIRRDINRKEPWILLDVAGQPSQSVGAKFVNFIQRWTGLFVYFGVLIAPILIGFIVLNIQITNERPIYEILPIAIGMLVISPIIVSAMIHFHWLYQWGKPSTKVLG